MGGGVILTHQETGWKIEALPIYGEEAGGCRTTVVKPLLNACAGWYETSKVSKENGDVFIPGQAAFKFVVEQPGNYQVAIDGLGSDEFTLHIVPDHSWRNQQVLFLSFLVHIGIIGLSVGVIYYIRNKDKIRAKKTTQREKRSRFDEWLEGAQETE